MRCSSYSWWYSKPCMTRKLIPRALVPANSNAASRRSFILTARTPSAIRELLTSSTAVSIEPSSMSVRRLASEPFGVENTTDGVAGKQNTKEQDLRRQKQPHAEGRRLALLSWIVELLFDR